MFSALRSYLSGNDSSTPQPGDLNVNIDIDTIKIGSMDEFSILKPQQPLSTPSNRLLFPDRGGQTELLHQKSDSSSKPSRRICIAFDLDNGLFDSFPGLNVITGFDENRWKAFTNAITKLAQTKSKSKHKGKDCLFIGLTNNRSAITSHRLNTLLPIEQESAYKLASYAKIRDAQHSGNIILLSKEMSKTDSLLDLVRNYEDLRSKHVYLLSTNELKHKEPNVTTKFKFLPYQLPTDYTENFYDSLANIEQSVIDWMLASLNSIRQNLDLPAEQTLESLIGNTNYRDICARDSFRNLVTLTTSFNERIEAIDSANQELRKLFNTLNTEKLRLSKNNKTDYALNQKVKALEETTRLCTERLERLKPQKTNNQLNETQKLALLKQEFGPTNREFKESTKNCLLATHTHRDYTTMAVNFLIGSIAFFATGVIPGIIYFVTQGRLWQPIDTRSYKESSKYLDQIDTNAETPTRSKSTVNNLVGTTSGMGVRNI